MSSSSRAAAQEPVMPQCRECRECRTPCDSLAPASRLADSRFPATRLDSRSDPVPAPRTRCVRRPAFVDYRCVVSTPVSGPFSRSSHAGMAGLGTFSSPSTLQWLYRGETPMSTAKTRYFLVGSAAILTAGLAAGTVAYMGGMPRAFASNAGPDELSLVPVRRRRRRLRERPGSHVVGVPPAPHDLDGR